MSWVMEYNIIAGGPVGIEDVEAAFGRWGRVRPLDGGAVDVVIGDCWFVIAPEASLSVNPAFVRWVAHARGFGGSAHVHSAEVDESYLESEGEETEVSRQVEAGFARLAERVGGVYAPFFQGDAIDYTDTVGGEYDFAGGAEPVGQEAKAGFSRPPLVVVRAPGFGGGAAGAVGGGAGAAPAPVRPAPKLPGRGGAGPRGQQCVPLALRGAVGRYRPPRARGWCRCGRRGGGWGLRAPGLVHAVVHGPRQRLREGR